MEDNLGYPAVSFVGSVLRPPGLDPPSPNLARPHRQHVLLVAPCHPGILDGPSVAKGSSPTPFPVRPMRISSSGAGQVPRVRNMCEMTTEYAHSVRQPGAASAVLRHSRNVAMLSLALSWSTTLMILTWSGERKRTQQLSPPDVERGYQWWWSYAEAPGCRLVLRRLGSRVQSPDLPERVPPRWSGGKVAPTERDQTRYEFILLSPEPTDRPRAPTP